MRVRHQVLEGSDTKNTPIATLLPHKHTLRTSSLFIGFRRTWGDHDLGLDEIY